jgi:hypothetical protein
MTFLRAMKTTHEYCLYADNEFIDSELFNHVNKVNANHQSIMCKADYKNKVIKLTGIEKEIESFIYELGIRGVRCEFNGNA